LAEAGGDEGLQALGVGGVATDVELEDFERLVQVGDLDARRLGLGAAQAVHHGRADQAGQQRDDGDDHQHLDQGEARAARAIGGG
jgi:hypothetical protein